MGNLCGGSLSEEEKREAAKNRTIDQKNKAAHKEEQAKVKLLLLGAGESGKSTIFKQMKILYGSHHGFTNEERTTFAPTVYGNIITNMKTVLENTENHSPIKNSELQRQMDAFLKKDEGKEALIDQETGAIIKAFWNDPDVQATWKMRASFQVQDALAYYCAEIDRISANNYVPTPQDILRARVRTSGIVEETYVIDGVTFVMFDVGGQRNERKKWIHCFDDVTAVIFVAAMNEYDQVLYEDSTMNRMNEAVILFEEICNSQFFTRTSMILFLNKSDLFRDKLAVVPFSVTEGKEQRFTDFQGPHVQIGGPSSRIGSPEYEKCYKAATQYLVNLFLNRNRQKGQKEVYSHITCATDTQNVEVVFNATKDIILRRNLLRSGFISSDGN